MRIVNMHQAKTHLSRLVEQARAGEDIVIGKAGTPVARLVPYSQPRERRRPGALEGKIRIADDFDAPLPKAVAAAFRGESE